MRCSRKELSTEAKQLSQPLEGVSARQSGGLVLPRQAGSRDGGSEGITLASLVALLSSVSIRLPQSLLLKTF